MLRLLACVLVVPLNAAWAAASVTPVAPPTARVIVKLRTDSPLLREPADPQDGQLHPMRGLARREGLAFHEGRRLSSRTQVVMATGLSSQALAQRLARHADVEYAVVDHWRHINAVPNDTYYAAGPAQGPTDGQWYLHAPDSTYVSAINAPPAWDITQGATNQVVAVIDTGIRPEHPDLQGKIQVGYDMIANTKVSNDGTGRDADPSDPGDWNTAGACGSGVEDNLTSTWHGTQVAGIIGALTNNGEGMAGLGWNVKVMPVRVLGRCGGYDSDISAGMLWAAGLSVPGVPANPYPAKILNLSLGGSGTCAGSVYPDVIAQVGAQGAVVVVSAGNSNGLAVEVPANCSGVNGIGSYVIAVAGVRHAGTKVGYSAQGPEVTLSAPAGNCVSKGGPCLYPILTTTNTGTQGPAASSYSDGNTPSLGTSFSAPMVSATVALMRSVNPSLSAADIKDILRNTANGSWPVDSAIPLCPMTDKSTDPDGTPSVRYGTCNCTTSTCGAGMLDVGKAVQAAKALWTQGAQAGIGSTPLTPLAGQSVVLDASPSVLSGLTISAYTWTITSDGGVVAKFQDSGDVVSHLAQPTLQTTGVGSFTVQLQLDLSDGSHPSTSQTIHVIAPLPDATSSGGGGGGALQAWPVAGLALSLLVLSAATRRGERRR